MPAGLLAARPPLVSIFVALILMLVSYAVMPATGATTYTRAASCAGLAFQSKDYASDKNTNGALLVRGSGSGGSVAFVCDPGLPHKAVVTKMQFTLYDVDQFSEVNCSLKRSGLEIVSAPTVQTMAGPLSTGTAFNGGDTRLVDTTIGNATIDNTKFGYWIECQIVSTVAGFSVGIYGANVTYRITAANG